MAALRGDISFRYLKQFFLVKPVFRDHVMARTRKYYLKNNYLTLMSKVKVPRRFFAVCDTLPYGHAHTYQI
jgi:hypothetical protein